MLDDMLKQTPPFMVSSIVALVAGTIGLLGLVLSAMGICGTLSYMVVLRAREVGIRMVLGARRGEVLWLILRQTSTPVIYGLISGGLLAVGISICCGKCYTELDRSTVFPMEASPRCFSWSRSVRL
jgi:ABC-type antimicrobial peptide transport system permease subunit